MSSKQCIVGGHFLTHNYPHPRDRVPIPRRKPLRYKPSLVSYRVIHHPRPVEHFKP